jgi:hypothetical protein
MKSLILVPRPDISSKDKEGPPNIGPPSSELKALWGNFAEQFALQLGGADIQYVALGGLTTEYVKSVAEKYDKVYVPHRQRAEFDCGPKALYYMQMVFPWLFSIDKEGWCAGSSQYPIQPEKHDSHPKYYYLKKHCDDGGSKFDQKNNEFNFPEKYILYTIQIPYDLTIQYHSDIQVIDAMSKTIIFGKEIGIPVLVKNHPSLKPRLKQQFINRVKELKWGEWIEDIHILDCIRNSEAVVTVNSGTGMEAIMQDKPVFTFGRADYDAVAHKELNVENWNDKYRYIYLYKNFIESYCEKMFEVNLFND